MGDRKTVEIGIIIMIAIIAAVLVTGVIFVRQQDTEILPPQGGSIELSKQDQRYLSEHGTITVSVPEELSYLIGDEKGGYLQDYMAEVLRPTGAQAAFTLKEDADCSLIIVTQQARNERGARQYTSPLFQMAGRLFVRGEASDSGDLNCVLTDGRIKEQKQDELTYKGRKIRFDGIAENAQKAVNMALSDKADGIIGDASTIAEILRDKGMENDFLMEEKSLYSYNCCIMVDNSSPQLHEILNQCIHHADRHNLSYDVSRKWLDGTGPVYMEQDIERSFLPVLIIILSILIAFFVYYITNRNMYWELSDRMDKIRAGRMELQTTFHSVGHYLAELSTDGEITDLNRIFSEEKGFDALHRKVWDAMGLDEEGCRALQNLVECTAAGNQAERIECSVGRKVFVMDVFPVEDGRGNVEKLLFMAIDVTQERMAKRQVLQDNKMIAVGQLAAGVAHEIRNPLGIIRNYCYVLKNMDDPDVRAKAIEEIENAVEKSGDIIRNLLDFSRASTGREELIDVERHIRQILLLHESSQKKKGIEFAIESPAEKIETMIACEAFDMVLLNLVSNAIDAMSEGDRLTISLENGESEFSLRVSDTGVGMDEDMLEDIFNPFYTTKGNNGTGLGLYIVYNEIEKLGGEIDVSSEKGVGTTFLVTLPIRGADEKENTV